jgi:hypothetical protein
MEPGSGHFFAQLCPFTYRLAQLGTVMSMQRVPAHGITVPGFPQSDVRTLETRAFCKADRVWRRRGLAPMRRYLDVHDELIRAEDAARIMRKGMLHDLF